MLDMDETGIGVEEENSMTSRFTLGSTCASTPGMSISSRLARSLRLRPGPGLRVRLEASTGRRPSLSGPPCPKPRARQ